MTAGTIVSMPNTAAGRHTNFTLSPSGGSIYLYNVDGVTQAATVSYPALAADVSTAERPTDRATGRPSHPQPRLAESSRRRPRSSLSSTSVADNQAAGTTVGTFTSTDADPFDTFTYSLVSGTGSSGNAAFSISGNTLQTAAVLNAGIQNSYSIRVRATDTSGLYTEQVFTISVTHMNVAARDPNTGLATAASPNQAVTVDSTVTDEQGLTGVNLTYNNKSQTVASTLLAETFGTAPTATDAHWTGGTGTGTDGLWTVVGAPAPFLLSTSANYGDTRTNACGLQFNCKSDTNATTDSITTTIGMNAAGLSAQVVFWVKTTSATSLDTWALALNSGNGYVPETCQLVSGASGSWQEYVYPLASSELSSNLTLRFQFTGGGSGDAGVIDLDQITVNLVSAASPVTVSMYDDGAHHDGVAGDNVFGAESPPRPSAPI